MIVNEIQATLSGWLNSLSGGDSIAKGLITVWFLTTLTYFAKSVPAKILVFIKANAIISYSINKDGDSQTSALFTALESWFIKHNVLTLRNRAVTSFEDSNVEGFGYGTNYVLCKGRFYKIIKTKSEKAGTSKIIESLAIHTLGRDPLFMSNIMEHCREDKNKRYYWLLFPQWRSFNPWHRVNELKPLPVISMNAKVKKEIDEKLKFFSENKQWYLDNNIPYKLTILLYGPPGTGKTSIIRYIADYLKADLYDLKLEMLNSEVVNTAAAACRKGVPAVIAFEDFEPCALDRQHKYRVRQARQADENNDEKGLLAENKDMVSLLDDQISGFQLSSFLNVLQGINPLENVVLVLTTNHIEKVDEAAIRNGRVDVRFEIGPLGLPELRAYFQKVYKQPFPNSIEQIKPIKPCDMEAIFRNNPFDAEAFIDVICKDYEVKAERNLPLEVYAE